MNTPPTTQLSPNQRALLKIRDLKQQVEDLKSANARSAFGGEIAIVSMACRFPRSANTPEAFWQSLVDQTDEVGPIPDNRWDNDAFHDDDPDVPGKMYARQGVFLDAIDMMDPEFFGISPREATWVDPQQRLLMEVGYEALERAGWQADRIAETTGVFVGWMHNDYQNEASDSFLNLNPYIATGAAGSFLCGRLAYYLGLQGPSIAIDTACSSSLVAIHLACQSLQQGDCDQALVGGVNAICSPTTNILTCKLKALSPTGQSRAFDAAADGYLRGEGCGVVTLKRLEDAQRDGDPVLGVIRGSAVGHNGFSSGLTAPNPKAQEKVIRAALARAGVAPEDVGYLEAHGTGTELGDPIEMQAAAAALAEGRQSDNPLLVGSVKTNIGHLEAAAGMAGIIKVLLAMQNDAIPGQMNFETPNPHIAWDKIAVKVLTDQTPWPREQKIAGVSAFGMSGTNAHLVIEAPGSQVRCTGFSRNESEDDPAEAGTTSIQPQDSASTVIVVSGKSDESVRQLAGDYARHLGSNPETSIADIGFTSTCGRSHYEHRGAIVASSTEQAIERLRELERSTTNDAAFSGQHRRTPKVAWQFTGQGSQYLSMGKGLYDAWPVFKEAIDQCDAWLMPLRKRALTEVMFGDDETSIHQTQWTQPAIFAVQMGLAKLLQSWGFQPDAVLGHSVGQYAAACVAGVMSWQDGLNLISHRGRLIGDLPTGGQMLAVFASVEAVNKAIDLIDDLALAANNISHIVVSGSANSIEAAEAHFASQSVRTKRLKTSHAFHSNLMEPALAPFAAIANKIDFKKPQLPLICNVSGKVLAPETVLDGQYWADHIRQSVQYSQSVEAAHELGCEVLLELGPHAVLTQMANSKWQSPQSHLVACLKRDGKDDASIFGAVGKLYACGLTANFHSIHAGKNRKPVVLPTYPFERRRFWGPDKPRAAHAAHHTAHPLLGGNISLAGSKSEQRFETHIESDSPVWLPDHEVMGQAVMPGAAFIEMALGVVKSNSGFGSITDAKFEQPLSPSARTALQTVVRTDGDERKMETYSAVGESNTWSRHFTATLAAANQDVAQRPPAADLEQLKSSFTNNVEADSFYSKMSELGLAYGSAFQTIDSLATSDGGVLAQLSSKSDVRGYAIAPPLLDGCIHSLAVGILDDDNGDLFLPVGIKRVQFHSAASDEVWCHAVWTKPDGDVRTADLTLYDGDGNVIAELEELTVRQVNRAALRKMGGSGSARLLYEMQWQPYRLPAPNSKKRQWMLVCQNNNASGQTAQDLLAPVAEKLNAAGHGVVCVTLCESSGAQIDDQSIKIGGSKPDWQTVFDHLSTEDAAYAPDGILWCVADDTDTYLTNAGPTQGHVEGVLNLVGALADAGVRRLECGLQWATAGGMATASPDADQTLINVSQAKYAGLARVIGAEQPELRCRLIDLESFDSENDPTQPLFDFLTTETTESQFAVRGGEFFVPRLKPVKLKTSSETFNVDAGGSYLITGGLGALGRQAGKWLADKGAGQVVLVSRRRPDEATQAFLDQINESGCEAIVASADFGSQADVKTLLARFGDDLMPLKGVIHAAGVLDDGLIGDQTWERFEKVLAPKIIGASLLHEATKSLDLDFFILYSSVASVLGSRGQSNYALANAYLDGLAWQRRQMGLPGLAVNWGPWAAGMADDPRILKRMALQGITPLANDEAHEVLEKMITGDLTQTTVMDVDWRRMQMGLGGESPSLLEGLAPSRKRSGRSDSEFVAKLKKLKGPARREQLRSTVSGLLEEILSTDGEPENDRPLIEMGLDSLMAVEFGTELQMLMGDSFTIAPTMLFDHHTIDAITDHVLELVEESGEGDGVDSTSGAAKSTADGASGNERTRSVEDIAIIGLSCRFPGAANVDEFWENLLGGVDSVCDIPSDRWDVDKFYSPDRQPGKMVSRSGGFIDDIGDFDAPFFNVSAEEACWIDPQHRMLLEHSYRGLEHAGICPHPLADNKVGVFMGIMGQDYAFLPKLDNPEIVAAFQGAGLSHSAGVGRISYHFGFEGPSVAVDTASSSSLVALYQAMRSLQEGTCNMALAGGVNAILAPVNSLLMSKAGLLSPQGRCKSFSAEADGFGRGEGCGVVVLKRLSDARADGDRIMAVVKGGAVSHNGFSGGITAPSGKAQTRVITDALADARVAPNQVQYLEAHGTGTEYGDPMELSAAAAVYGKGRSSDDPLLVGSVKANISHLEAAGGVSGLIKTVMAIHTGTLPQQLHFEQPSPHIPWDRMPIKMVDQQQTWPECETRYAGVTALGLVGTNAHIVLASAPPVEEGDEVEPDADVDKVATNQLLVLSGKDGAGLKRVVDQFETFLENNSDADFADICFSSAVGRRQFDHRIAVVAANNKDAAAQLRTQMEATAEQENAFTKNPKISFWFSGTNVGATQALAELSEQQPVVRNFVADLEQRLSQFSLSDDWKKITGESEFDKDAVDSDVALFALQASLVKLWEHWGVEPDSVAGTGVGQYLAACSAGGLCFLEAVTLIAARESVLKKKNANATDEEVTQMLDAFEAYADTLNFYPPNRALVCSVSGAEVPVYKSLAGSYWRDHCLHGCGKDDIARTLTAVGEIESNFVLTFAPASDKDTQFAGDFASGATILRSDSQSQSIHSDILTFAAVLYRGGASLNLTNVFSNQKLKKVDLPGYPLSKKRYWITEIPQQTPPQPKSRKRKTSLPS